MPATDPAMIQPTREVLVRAWWLNLPDRASNPENRASRAAQNANKNSIKQLQAQQNDSECAISIPA